MSQARQVWATFSKAFPLNLTINGNGDGTVTSIAHEIVCSVDCSQNFTNRSEVTLVATPDTGSVFSGWSGVCSGMGPCSVTMNQTQNVNATFTIVPPPDLTPPTVTLTAPTDGAVVTETTVVTATATDASGVVGVQFLLDGNSIGSEDTTAPYSVSWDTTTAVPGSHTLGARARDAAGNMATVEIGVTVVEAPVGSLAYQQATDAEGLVVMEVEHAHVNTSQGAHSWTLSTPVGSTGVGL